MWAGQALRGGSSQGAWEEDGKTNPGYFCGKHAWRARPTPGTVWAPAMLEGSPHPRDSVGTRHAGGLAPPQGQCGHPPCCRSVLLSPPFKVLL